MSLKINFYPLHFILSLLALVSLVIIFNGTVYTYMSSNIYVNGFIVLLFIICMIWVLGVLSYFDRSTRVLNKLLATINPSMSQAKKDAAAGIRKQSLYVASSIGGTLFDTPIFSRAIVSSIRSGRLDISLSDTDVIINAVNENGNRVMGPSRFLTSLFTMLGLAGTFIGLLETIDGVGRALAALSNVQSVDILSFVKLLSDPLQGMALAFSASLFGLAGALFGNYGNYVCNQKLAVFASKFRNFLTASSALALGDPNRIEAKDILISLEDSFNRLYMGLAERLDAVAEGMVGMSKTMLRSQEKQEKILRVILQNFANMEEMWIKFIKSTESLKYLNTLASDINMIVGRHREEILRYMDKNVLPVMQDTAESTNRSVKVGVASLDVSKELTGIAKNTLDGVAHVDMLTDRMVGISEEHVGVAKVSLSAIEVSNEVLKDVASLTDKGNSISDAILSANFAHMDVSRDSRALLTDSLSEHQKGNAIAADAVSELISGNNLSSSILTEVTNGNGLASAILNEITSGNAISTNILGEVVAGNGIASTTLDEVTNGNNIANSILGEVTAGNVLASTTLDEIASGNAISNTILGEVASGNGINNSILEEVSAGNALSNAILGEVNNANGLVVSVLNEVATANQLSNGMLNELVISNELSNAIAAAVNASTQATEELSKVVASNSEVLPALLESSYNNGNQLYNLLATSYQNLEASNLVAEVSSEMLLASQEVAETMRGLNEVVVKAMTDFSEMSYNVNYNTELLTNAFESFADRFVNIVDSLEDSVGIIERASIIGQGLDQTVYQLNTAMEAVLPNVVELVDATNRQIDSVSFIVDNIASISAYNEEMANYTENMFMSLRSIEESTVSSYEGMNSNLSEIIEYLNKFDNQNFNIMNGMENLTYEFSNMRSEFETQVSNVVEGIAVNVENVLDAFSGISNNMRNIGDLVERVDAFLERTEVSQADGFNIIAGELQALNDSQRTFLEVLEGNLSGIADSVGIGVGDLVTKLDEMQRVSDMQIDRLLSMESTIGQFADSSVDFVRNVDADYRDLHNVISELSQSFSGVSEGLKQIAEDILSQTDMMERHTLIMENNVNASNAIVDAIYDFSSSNQDLKSVAENIRLTSDALMGFGDTLNRLEDSLVRLEEVTSVQDSSFSNLGDRLLEDVTLLSDMIERLNRSVSGFSLDGLQGEITSLSNNVDNFINTWNVTSGQLLNSSEQNGAELASILGDISRDIVEIRDSILDNLSQNTTNSLVKLAEDNNLMLEKLGTLMPNIEDIAKAIGDGSRGMNNEAILNALDDLKNEYNNGNARLDVIANAIDSLITEMLNSRDVAQSILDMVARINGYTKK